MLELSMLARIWFRNLLLFLSCIFMLLLARQFLMCSSFLAFLPRMCVQGSGSCKGLSQDMTTVVWNVFISLQEQLRVPLSQTQACNVWTWSSELKQVGFKQLHIFSQRVFPSILSAGALCLVVSLKEMGYQHIVVIFFFTIRSVPLSRFIWPTNETIKTWTQCQYNFKHTFHAAVLASLVSGQSG